MFNIGMIRYYLERYNRVYIENVPKDVRKEFIMFLINDEYFNETLTNKVAWDAEIDNRGLTFFNEDNVSIEIVLRNNGTTSIYYNSSGINSSVSDGAVISNFCELVRSVVCKCELSDINNFLED